MTQLLSVKNRAIDEIQGISVLAARFKHRVGKRIREAKTSETVFALLAGVDRVVLDAERHERFEY